MSAPAVFATGAGRAVAALVKGTTATVTAYTTVRARSTVEPPLRSHLSRCDREATLQAGRTRALRDARASSADSQPWRADRHTIRGTRATLSASYCLVMWTTTADAREFLDVTGALLRADVAGNTELLSVAASVAENGPGFYGEEPPLFGWWAGMGVRIDGAFVHTPPHPALLSAVPHAAIDPLAELLARDRRLALAGVSADARVAEGFGAAWSARRQTTAELALRLRLYRLTTLRAPDPPAPGRADAASVADEALMRDLMEAFEREVGEPPGIISRTLDKRLAAGSLTIWRDVRGTPVAFAGYSIEVEGTRRIGPVYTVTQHRRHGYGAAVTVAASRRALDSGTSQLLLYADIDNLTSNRVYQRLGFEPIGSRTTLHFKDRS